MELVRVWVWVILGHACWLYCVLHMCGFSSLILSTLQESFDFFGTMRIINQGWYRIIMDVNCFQGPLTQFTILLIHDVHRLIFMHDWVQRKKKGVEGERRACWTLCNLQLCVITHSSCIPFFADFYAAHSASIAVGTLLINTVQHVTLWRLMVVNEYRWTV